MSSKDKNKKNQEEVVLRQDDIEHKTAELTGVDKDVVKNVFNTFWDVLCRELELGSTIKLHGKGKFYLSKRSARMGRNPLTGKPHKVPEREAMAFQTSPAYAKRLRDKREEVKDLSEKELEELRDYTTLTED